jgi:hypothetical protein
MECLHKPGLQLFLVVAVKALRFFNLNAAKKMYQIGSAKL